MSWVRQSFKAIGRRIFRRASGERSIRASYQRNYGKPLNDGSPRTFTEKVFHRMIEMERASDRRFTPLVDKYLVRDYVSQRVGSEHLVKLLWHGRDPQSIPFDSLPGPYIIKTNHGSGGHAVVNGHADQPDRAQLIARFRAALRTNYYWRAREFQYFHIVPQLLVEELIDDDVPAGLLDYRCWCFHGRVRLIQVENHAYSHLAFFDREWNRQDLRHRVHNGDELILPKPANLAKLVEVAEALARGIDFVRVDLYNIRDRVCFGELTFTPRAGLFSFQPESWDLTIGDWW